MGYSPRGHKELDTTETIYHIAQHMSITFTVHFACIIVKYQLHIRSSGIRSQRLRTLAL